MSLAVVRVRTKAKTLRLPASAATTLRQLKEQVEVEVGVPFQHQRLAKDPAGRDEVTADGSSLGSLGFRNGQMLHLLNDLPSTGAGASAGPVVLEAGRIVSVSDSKMGEPKPAQRTLTKRCAHGPRGACRHCCPPDENADAEPLNKAFRYTRRTQRKVEDVSGDIEWLCQHPIHQMCTNCAPLRQGEKVELEMLCAHPPDGQCINCLPSDAIEGRKHLTYQEFLAKRKAKCEHAFSATCINCMPPSEIRYTLKPGCTKHKPWPLGLCNECQPPPATLARQTYRHVDFVEARNLNEVRRFMELWRAGSYTQQRAGFMYGRVEPNPSYPDGKMAVIEAIYEPPQVCSGEGFLLLPDPKAEVVDRIAAALGLHKIGWIFTHFPRSYFLASEELRQMARFQLENPMPKSARSEFVTVVMTAQGEDIVSKAYQASDVLMALERDIVLSESKNPEKFKVREPGPRDILPDIIQNKKSGPATVSEFDVEYMMVQLNDVGTSAAAGPAPVLKHSRFPIENRGDFGETQSRADLRAFINAGTSSEPSYETWSDFHALVYAAEAFDAETAVSLAKAVADKTPVGDGIAALL